jgi:hypothetical protein
MSRASISVLGLYSPKANQAHYEAYLSRKLASLNPVNYSTRMKAMFRKFGREDELAGWTESELLENREELEDALSQAVLIEVLVSGATKQVDVGKFVQPLEGVANERWKVAYGEKYLSEDGTRKLGDDQPALNQFRIAFYIHCWQQDGNLRGPSGPLVLPPMKPLPARLWRLVPYEPDLWS